MFSLRLLTYKAATVRDAVGKAAPKLVHLQVPDDLDFVVDGDFDKRLKTEGKDLGLPLILQEMADVANKLYQDFVRRTADYLAKSDKTLAAQPELMARPGVLDSTSKKVAATIRLDRDRTQEQALAAMAAYWTDLRKKPGHYTKYKVKIGVKTFLGVAGLGTSVGLMAASGITFGASAVIGVVGLMKSANTLASELVSAAQEIETAQDQLEKAIDVVRKGLKAGADLFGKHERELAGDKAAKLSKTDIAKEAGKIVIAQFLGTSGPLAIWPSIKEVKGRFETVQAKWDGVKLTAHKLARKLDEAVAQAETVKKTILEDAEPTLREAKKASADFDDARARKNLSKRVDQELAPLQTQLDRALRKTLKAVERSKEAQRRLEASGDVVEQLLALKSAKAWTVFENALPLTDLLLSATNAQAYAEVAEAAGEFGPSIVGLAADKVTQRIFEGSWWE